MRMPMLLQDRSMNSLHVFCASDCVVLKDEKTYGAMITLAPGIGSCFPSIVEGTSASQESRDEERVVGEEEYQDPAWLAVRVVMVR